MAKNTFAAKLAAKDEEIQAKQKEIESCIKKIEKRDKVIKELRIENRKLSRQLRDLQSDFEKKVTDTSEYKRVKNDIKFAQVLKDCEKRYMDDLADIKDEYIESIKMTYDYEGEEIRVFHICARVAE